MSSANLLRWSGLAFLLSGALIALFFLLHPIGDPPPAQVILSTPYAAEHTLGIASRVLNLLGLIGVYAWLAQKQRWLALIGFLLASIGTALLLGGVIVDATINPVLASSAPKLLDPTSTLFTGPTEVVFLVYGLIYALGFIIVGMSTLLMGGFSRWAGIPLIVGALLVAYVFAVPWIVRVIGAVVFGLGQVWVGYAVWSARGEMLRQPELAP